MGETAAKRHRSELVWLFVMVAISGVVLTLGLLTLVRKPPGPDASKYILAGIVGLAAALAFVYLTTRPSQRRREHIASIVNGHLSSIPWPPSPSAAITKSEPRWYVVIASAIWAAWLFLGLTLAPDHLLWFFLLAAITQTVWERWRGRTWALAATEQLAGASAQLAALELGDTVARPDLAFLAYYAGCAADRAGQVREARRFWEQAAAAEPGGHYGWRARQSLDKTVM